jgi:hypothetical protein
VAKASSIVNINVESIGANAFLKYMGALKSDDMPRIINRGIRYAATRGKTAVKAALRESFTLKASVIGSDITVPTIRSLDQSAAIKLSRTPRTSLQYQGRQLGGIGQRPQPGLGRGKGRATLRPSKRQGYKWKIIKRQPGRFTRYGFVGKAPAGGLLPYLRHPGTRKLTVIHGPSIHAAFTAGEHSEEMKSKVGAVVSEALETGVARALRAHAKGF